MTAPAALDPAAFQLPPADEQPQRLAQFAREHGCGFCPHPLHGRFVVVSGYPWHPACAEAEAHALKDVL